MKKTSRGQALDVKNGDFSRREKTQDIDLKEKFRNDAIKLFISNNEMKFHDANLLASQHERAYTRFCLLHLLLWWIKPEPQLPGLFFVPRFRSTSASSALLRATRVLVKTAPLTQRLISLYNSKFSSPHARGERLVRACRRRGKASTFRERTQ
ncbi:hypothetical protein [Caballeronia sp. LZ034LL]|uniref:hypothetical protein n=1 Tax=Caballeronia sp. LZ034LL TaxID=3038567 RepID=UPI0028658C40|nr:hypothetical protein [Caballeronia sp. LZ034LL]MDR5832869.1 hypothetical protein [Caballeronia sp. LZ034LL]